MNGEMDLLRLFQTLLKRWWLLVLCVVICAGAAFGYSKFVAVPVYMANGTLYIANDSNRSNRVNTEVNLSDLMLAQELTKTYIELLSSNSFFKAVAEASELPYTYKQLQAMTGLSAKNETEVIQISVACPNPEHACKIADTILDTSQYAISEIVNGGSVKIIDGAEMPERPYLPNTKRNTAVGVLLGLLVGAAIAITVEMLDNRVRGQESLEAHYDIPVLGCVPRYYGQKNEIYDLRKLPKKRRFIH